MARQKITITTEDGCRLHAHVRTPKSSNKGVVVLFHALMVDGRTLDRRGPCVAATLQAAGWTTLTVDLRGHGQSKVGGENHSYTDLFKDIEAVVSRARRFAPKKPLIIFGHSLGGHASLAAATQGVVADAYVLFAASPWLSATEVGRRRRWMKHACLTFLARSSKVLGYFPSAALKLGTADVSGQLFSDFQAFFVSGWGADGEWLKELRWLKKPVLAVVGGADHTLCDLRSMRLWLDHLGEPADVWVAEKGWFGLKYTPNHMSIVTSRRGEPLWLAVCDWLEAFSHTWERQ